MPIPLLALMAAGAVAGGVANRKDPLKGALMGAGLGATGGLLAPAAMGAVGGAGAGGLLGAPATGALGAPAAGMAGMPSIVASSAGDAGMMYAGADAAAAGSLGGGAMSGASTSPGLLGMAKEYAPLMNSAQGLLNQPEQQGAAPQGLSPKNAAGAQTLASLAQQDPQGLLVAEAEKRRQRRQGLLGGTA